MNRITRHNYEEYFILYMDNELSSDDRRMVEAFVQQHPDLKEELDLLLHYKLEPDTNIVFAGKEELLKATGHTPLSVNNYEEWLSLYVDNELDTPERLELESFITQHSFVAKELALLQMTKPEPENIVFPHKSSLYRKEEKVRVVRFAWWRIAAAAVILLLAVGSVLLITNNNRNGGGSGNSTAKNGKPVNNNPVISPVKENENTQPLNPVEKNSTVDQQNEIAQTNTKENNRQAVHPAGNEKEIRSPNTVAAKDNKESNKPAPGMNTPKKEEQILADNNGSNKTNGSNPVIDPLNNPKKNIDEKTDATYTIAKTSNPTKETNNTLTDVNDPKVTKDSYGTSQDGNPAVTYASLEEGSKNKKSRGLFRKVARTFEKRTNMSATDDNRLLVAGFSLKLK